MAGRCLMALSMNSSRRVTHAIEAWKESPDGQAVDWSSYIVDSAFNLEMIKRFGQTAWANIDFQQRDNAFQEWISQGEGMEFYQRFLRLNKIVK